MQPQPGGYSPYGGHPPAASAPSYSPGIDLQMQGGYVPPPAVGGGFQPGFHPQPGGNAPPGYPPANAGQPQVVSLV